MSDQQHLLQQHRQALLACTRCPAMIRPVVSGKPVLSPVLLIGQAPGDKEGVLGKPFAWTAGKTMFKWFAQIGLDEATFRERVYMAAVCRCFPGKNPKGGDRVPNPQEIQQCASWLQAEVELLQPKLIIPVGKLAIQQMLEVDKLSEVIGGLHRLNFHGHDTDVIPLPHPSGASTWHRTEPGAGLLEAALATIQAHAAWRQMLGRPT
ncbi:uracil-DNA glycosylase family protein [Methylomonas sp. TEB]|uniref:uracil-DNA glycosylase family protein n=1 Tax=Methylomonas sp. TEB TaxID=3398229 RepID=UPI0039F52E8E